MFSEKLGSLLVHFSAAEMGRLAKFVSSPYNNEHAEVVQLFQMLRGAHTRGAEHFSKLTKPEIWAQLFPKRAYNDNQLRKLIFELTNLTTRFLAVEHLAKSPWDQTRFLQEVMERFSLEKQLTALQTDLSEMLEAEKTWRPEHFLRAHEHTFSLLEQGSVAGELLKQLHNTKLYLDVFYAVRSLKLAITHKTFSLSRQADANDGMYLNLAQQIAESELLSVPIVKVFYLAFVSFSDPDNEPLYQEFKHSLQEHQAVLHPLDAFDLYQHALNICIIHINTGNQTQYREFFELYRTMTESGLIVAKGELAEGMFKNIITAGLAVKEYEWVEQFIRTQSKHLPEAVRQNAMSFNLANVLFSQKKFDEVIGLLQRVEYSDLVYLLGARWLLIRTYYELDEGKALESSLESFRVYLLRNKILSTITKKEYLSLISFTRALIKSRYEKEKLKTLKLKVQATQIKLPKRWLIEKIEELEKKR
jgi:hypothetical protein